MKTQAQRHDSLSRIAKLIEDLRICMLTTIGEDKKLLSRPMVVLEMDAEGDLWFLTRESSGKTTQLDSVNVAFTDEDKATYVSISGRGELVNDRARIDELWTPFAKPWFPQGKDDPDLVLLKVTTQIAEYWDAASSKMVRMLAMMASIAGGKPVGLGDHEIVHNPNAPARSAQPRVVLPSVGDGC